MRNDLDLIGVMLIERLEQDRRYDWVLQHYRRIEGAACQ